MIKDSSKGHFGTVIVYKLDRFARDRYDAATYKRQLKKNGVSLVSATEPLSGQPQDIIIESMLEGFAEYYSVELSQKIQRGIDESVRKRKFLGGPVPFGLLARNGELIPDPNTAPAVKTIFEMLDTEKTLAEVTAWLNHNGYRTKSGKLFGKSSLNKIIHNVRYTGAYVYKDQVIPNVWTPIIDQTTFDRVQIKLKQNQKRRKRMEDGNFLLTGKLICGSCGASMHGDSGTSKNGQPHYYYTCKGRKAGGQCHKKSIRKDVIEPFVIEKALEQLTDERTEAIISLIDEALNNERNTNIIPSLEEEKKDLEKKLDNLFDAIAEGLPSKRISGKIQDIEDQITVLDNRIESEKANQTIIDPQFIRFYLEKIKNNYSDVPGAAQTLVNAFVNKVILYDDDDGAEGNRRCKIVFNLGESSEEFDLYSLSSTIEITAEHVLIRNGQFYLVLNILLEV